MTTTTDEAIRTVVETTLQMVLTLQQDIEFTKKRLIEMEINLRTAQQFLKP